MVASQCLLASGGEKEYGRINVKTLVVGLVVCPFLCINFGSIGVAVGVCVRELINVFLLIQGYSFLGMQKISQMNRSLFYLLKREAENR